MRVTHREDVEAGGRLAVELGWPAGAADGIISGGPRFHVPAETAFCWTEVYLDGRLAPIVRPIDVLRAAVFSSWSRIRLAKSIVEIRQDIHPYVIDAAKAPILGSKVGDLALQITRRYSGTGGRLLLLSHTLLPGDRFLLFDDLPPGLIAAPPPALCTLEERGAAGN